MGRIKVFKTYEEASEFVSGYNQSNFEARDKLQDSLWRSEEFKKNYPSRPGLGNGLEFVCGINLIARDQDPRDYTFFGSMFAVLQQNHSRRFNYPSIENMAVWARKWLNECEEHVLGATVTPLVYTTNLTEEEMKDFEEHFFKE